ncbi:YjfI family protein [Reinekea forsetii]|nr:YjfI family protein [Reinekea forsetii]
MTTKTSAHYQREYRRRLREQGLIKKEVWVLPEHTAQLLAIEKQLRVTSDAPMNITEVTMNQHQPVWTAQSLFQALLTSDQVKNASIEIELVDGVEPVLLLVMKEFGDLPLYLSVCGEQIIVECLLWPVSRVLNPAAFNSVVLKTHKYYPLSTICLEATEGFGDCYFMFGALSSVSVLNSVLIEIETLASNVIQATEAYSEYLIDSSLNEGA